MIKSYKFQIKGEIYRQVEFNFKGYQWKAILEHQPFPTPDHWIITSLYTKDKETGKYILNEKDTKHLRELRDLIIKQFGGESL